jgi:hypothetical protein
MADVRIINLRIFFLPVVENYKVVSCTLVFMKMYFHG